MDKVFTTEVDGSTVQITEAEKTALIHCLNYGSREGQLSDNMSVGGAKEFRED